MPVAAVKSDVVEHSVTDDFYSKLDHEAHSGKYKIGPAALAMMRGYMVFPNEVKPTGPKGYITKEDVVNYANSHQKKFGHKVQNSEPAKQAASPAQTPAAAPASKP